jgi:ribosome-binding factor A
MAGAQSLTARLVHEAIGKSTMPKHHQKTSTPGGSQRQLRVGEIMRHAIADILSQGGVHDPVLETNLITVPEVRMSPDLKLATVYVMPLGGRNTELVLAALAANKTFLRSEAARRVNLKFAPDLRFRIDERFDEAERIEKLLRTPAVQRDLKPNPDEN